MLTFSPQVAEYVSSLRPAHHQEKASWAIKEAAVRNKQAELEKRFQEVLARLEEGRELESLPRVNVPALPRIPTVPAAHISPTAASLGNNFTFALFTFSFFPPPHRRPS